MQTYKLIGHIETVEPVNITLPNTKGMPRSQGLPMIPASSIRGWLRHAAHDGLVELFAKKDQLFSVDFHYLVASGVDTARVLDEKSQSTKVGANADIRRKHPLLSTFGYWGLAGKVAVGNAVATNKDALLVVNGGARQHVFTRNEKLSGFIKEEELDYLEDILKADAFSAEAIADHKIELKALKSKIVATTDKDEKAEIKEQIKEIEDLIRAAKDSRVGASESIRRPLENFEAIDAGQVLPHRILIKDPLTYELELTLWSIAMASLRPYIGGHNNANYGEIKAEWELFVTDIENLQPKSLGKIGFNEEGFFCTIAGFDAAEINQKILDGTINVAEFTK